MRGALGQGSLKVQAFGVTMQLHGLGLRGQDHTLFALYPAAPNLNELESSG